MEIFYIILISIVFLACLAAIPFMVFGGIWVTTEFIYSLRVHRDLKLKGYRWVSLFDAYSIRSEIGVPVNQIPPWEHIAVIPDYVEGDKKTFIEICKKLSQYIKKYKVENE